MLPAGHDQGQGWGQALHSVVVVVGLAVVVVVAGNVVVVDVLVVDVVLVEVVDVEVVEVVEVEVVDGVLVVVGLVVVVVELVVVAPTEVEVDDGAVELVEATPPAELPVAALVVVTVGAVVVGDGSTGKPPGRSLSAGARGTAREDAVTPTTTTPSTTEPVVVVEPPAAKKDSGSKEAATADSGRSLPRSQFTPPNTPMTSIPATISTITPETTRANRTLSRREALTLPGAVSARCLATLLAKSSGLTRPPSGLGKGGLPFPPGLPARKRYDRRALLSTGFGVCRGPGLAASPDRPRGQGLLLFGDVVATAE
jgi:hypothetical protein